MPKRYRKVRRARRRVKSVPGWGGAIGRVARVGMKYVSKGGMAYKALRLARKVADAVNIEYKNYDQAAAASTFDYNGTAYVLNTPAQGSADTQRIGDSIKCQGIVIRGNVQGTTTAGQLNKCRILLIWDEQNQIATLADLLELTGTSNVVFSPKNYDKRFRCRVLYDQLFLVGTQSGMQAFARDFEINLPINQHTQFASATTTINTGALKMFVCSDGFSTNLPQLHFYSRLSYTDD